MTDTKRWRLDVIIEKYTPPRLKSQMIPPYQPVNGETNQDLSELAAALGRIHVSSGSTQNHEPTSPVFPGGFHPTRIYPDSRMSSSLGSQTIAMPEPELSLTMRYALQPNYDPSVAAPSPPVTPQKPNGRRAQSRPNAIADSPSSAKVSISSHSVTPVKPTLPAGTSPKRKSSPSSQTEMVQCSGITQAQKPCTRMVKINYRLDRTSDKIEHFCHQHAKSVTELSGFYTLRDTFWVKFEKYIPAYLQQSTQATLRAEMAKARSAQDEPGYIYTFEIRDPGSKTIRLKVGRATNVVKRLDQWTKQCSSKEQVPRGIYPFIGGQDISLMKGLIQGGEKSPACHRLERLIHIELADLVSTCQYLEPGWPDNLTTSPSTPSASPKKKGKEKDNLGNKPCPDCGSRHQEIFEFWRWEKEGYQGQEWAKIVKPVIKRWGEFVEKYV